MSDYIDRCLGEGLLSPCKYFDLTEVGTDDFESDPETCFHEAGHAVVGYLQDRRIKHVYAAPFDEIAWDAFHEEYFIQQLGGQVAYEDDDDRPFPSDGDDAAKARWLKDEMLSTMGAGVAMCHFNGGGEPANNLSCTDQAAVYGNWLLEYCNLAGAFAECPFDMPEEPTEAQEEQWWEWTYAQMDRVEATLWAEVEQMLLTHWHLVEGLAAALAVNPFLDGTEVREIFERIEARRAAAA
jgi:hypothetical protein